MALAGCRTAAVSEALTQHDVAAISPASGEVALELIVDPDAPSVELGPDEDYVPPRLLPINPLPIYPSELLPLRLGPRKVIVRVIFDEAGEVLLKGRSPLQQSTAEHQDAFEEAALEAVSVWRCAPPRIRKFRPGPDSDGDGVPDYRILTSQRALKTFFDVSFTFEMVSGVPVIRVAG